MTLNELISVLQESASELGNQQIAGIANVRRPIDAVVIRYTEDSVALFVSRWPMAENEKSDMKSRKPVGKLK